MKSSIRPNDPKIPASSRETPVDPAPIHLPELQRRASNQTRKGSASALNYCMFYPQIGKDLRKQAVGRYRYTTLAPHMLSPASKDVVLSNFPSSPTALIDSEDLAAARRGVKHESGGAPFCSAGKDGQ